VVYKNKSETVQYLPVAEAEDAAGGEIRLEPAEANVHVVRVPLVHLANGSSQQSSHHPSYNQPLIKEDPCNPKTILTNPEKT
jgi:hypothetical protein